MKLFLDTNILLDILLQRQPSYEASALVFSYIEQGIYVGIVSPVSFTTIDYILKKHKSSLPPRQAMKQLFSVVSIGVVEASIIKNALNSSFDDFEDAVQYFTARYADSDCIITRNKKDFTASTIPVFLPEEFIVAQQLYRL